MKAVSHDLQLATSSLPLFLKPDENSAANGIPFHPLSTFPFSCLIPFFPRPFLPLSGRRWVGLCRLTPTAVDIPARKGRAGGEGKEPANSSFKLDSSREQDSWTARELERKTARDDEIKLESKLDLADAGKLQGNLVLKTQIWMQSAQ